MNQLKVFQLSGDKVSQGSSFLGPLSKEYGLMSYVETCSMIMEDKRYEDFRND